MSEEAEYPVVDCKARVEFEDSEEAKGRQRHDGQSLMNRLFHPLAEVVEWLFASL